MVDLNRALEDVAFISKRFQGLLELGDSLKEVQVLLNQRDSLKAAVEASDKALAASRADVAKAKDDLKKAQSDFVSKQKGWDQVALQYATELTDAKAKVNDVNKQYDALLKDAKAQADKVVADAKADAAAIKKASDDLVSDANSKLASIEAKIARIKATL